MMKKKFIQVGSFLVGFVMVPLLATVPCAGVFKEPKALLDVKEEAVADSEKKSILELLKAGHDAGAVVVAKVDNVPIFAQELLPFVNAMISRGPTSDEQGRREIFLQYLRHKIIECTLVCEAKRQGYTAKPKEIQVKFVEILKQFGTESMLEKRTGMTVVRFKEELGNSIVRKKLIDRLVDSRMKKVTESDTRSFYDRVIIKLNGGKVDLSSDDAEAVDIIVDLFKQKFDERVKFGQIFVSCPKNATPAQVKKAQEKVATIEKELQKSPFVEIAGQYSESSSEENIVEDIKDNLSPIKAKVIFAMQVGAQTKESFRDDDGFYFVKLFGKFAKQEIRYDDVKQLIASCLESIQKNRILNSFIEEILQNKDIKLFVF